MLKRFSRWHLYGLLLLLPLLVASLAGTYQVRRPKGGMQPAKSWQPELVVSSRMVDNRTMAIHAHAKVTRPHTDELMWWKIEIRQAHDDGSWTLAYEREFDQPEGWIRAKRMVEVKPVLDLQVPLPGPGLYHAYVSLLNDGVYVHGRTGEPIPGANVTAGRMAEWTKVE
jgi:hypothetical protein